MTKKKITQPCERCGTILKYSPRKKAWYCPDCLHGAYLSDLAQKAAQKRYRKSTKGKTAEKNYEQSPKGKTSRDKYLKSDKYKLRRKEYNERLKESLRIARESGAHKGAREVVPQIDTTVTEPRIVGQRYPWETDD